MLFDSDDELVDDDAAPALRMLPLFISDDGDEPVVNGTARGKLLY